MAIQLAWQRFVSEQAGEPARTYIPMVYEKVPTSPTPWEYHVLTVDTSEGALPNVVQLNELGQQGWMLAGCWMSASATMEGMYITTLRVRVTR